MYNIEVITTFDDTLLCIMHSSLCIIPSFHTERIVLITSAFELSILEVLDERESHWMDKRGDHTQGEVDAVTEQQDEDEWQPANAPTHRCSHVGS